MSYDPQCSKLFQSYYSNLFNDRWDRLYMSLLEPINTIALIPPFYSELNDNEAQILDKTDREVSDNSSVENVLFVNTVLPWCYTPVYNENVDSRRRYLSNTLITDGNGHISHLKDYTYYLDGASAFASFCLDVKPGDRVLDLCSAPGGKSLILAIKLFYKMGVNNTSMLSTRELIDEINSNRVNTDKLYKDGLLVCNEFVRGRYERMVDNMKKFIPDRYISSKNVQFTNFDGLDSAKFQRFGRFDKILLDAPCSSERHLIHNQSSWNQKNIKINSRKQIQLLESAIKLLKPMGIILYCTCALDPQENELVIYYILKSYNNIKHIPVDYNNVIRCSDVGVHDYSLYKPENRTYGCALMPDKSKFGPLYLAKLQKVD